MGAIFKIFKYSSLYFFIGWILIVFINKKYTKLKSNIIILILAIFISNIKVLYLEDKFDNLYLGLEKINIEGVITSEGKIGEYKTSYIIKVNKINGNYKYKNTYLNLYVKNGQKIKYGDKISFIGTFTEPSKRTNYKAFNYSEYLKTKYIYGNVSLDKDLKILKSNNLNSVYIFSNMIKNNIKKNLEKSIGKNSEIIKRNFTWRYFKYFWGYTRRF